MAVKIRLKRRGRKKLAMFDVVIADSRAPRDGKFIERIGSYNPNTDPATIDLNEEKAFDWVMKGAQPTDTVKAMLSYRGILLKKHLQIGVLKGAITQEEADKRFDQWLKQKEASIDKKRTGLEKDADKKRQDKLDAERKVNETRAESIRLKKEAEIEALKEEITADPEEKELAEEAEEAVQEAASEKAEAPVEEPAAEAKEEAPAAEAKEEPAVEAKEEAPVAEAKEAPAVEAKEEAPVAEAKEAPAAEVKKEEEAPAEEVKSESVEDKKSEADTEDKKKA